MANRRTYGINALWINLLCGACNKEVKTFDGIVPFTAVGDLSTPNPAYFRRADDIISLAATDGIVVLLDPIETSSWLSATTADNLEAMRETNAATAPRKNVGAIA